MNAAPPPSPLPGAWYEAVQVQRSLAAARRHRAVVVLTGDRAETSRQAQQLLALWAGDAVAWFGDQPPPGVTAISGKDARRLLGGERDVLVFDAWSGFDPDAFGALTGCVRAGGLLLLLAPVLDAWPDYADPQNARIAVAPYSAAQVGGRFLRRAARLIDEDSALLLCEHGEVVRTPVADAGASSAESPWTDAGPCCTRDQSEAVEAVVKVVTGHRRRPVVLVSDRGRGKSAAFGIAAARLAAQGKRRILLTAPRAEAVDTLMAHAERVHPGTAQYLRFLPPDELAAATPDCDLLLVDEAAAIPVPILERLLRRYARIAFATTVHGYEGTGRGFSVRFSRRLDALSNSWKPLALKTPIRWAPDDPLERLAFRLLALDAEPADDDCFPHALQDAAFEFHRFDRDALVADEAALSELFGLLVQAHYRTRPLDLRHLLDGPNLSVYVLRHAGHVAATALVAEEGGFDSETSEAIWRGQRRPHGHLLPETLAAHLGLRQAPVLRGGRIMRITVHPALQRRGLGRRLVTSIVAELAGAGYDYVGSSFGASPDLLAFWQHLAWEPVRLSIQKGASSGSHSLVMLQALTKPGRELLEQARRRFFAQFPHQLSDSLRDLDAALVVGLLRHGAGQAPVLDADDRRDLQAFAHDRRLAEVCIGSLWRLALWALMQDRGAALTAREQVLLVGRILQRHSWTEVAEPAGFSGRKAALRALRDAVEKLLV